MPFRLLYQNDDFVVVSKPAGMNFHSEEEAGLVVQAAAALNVDQLYSVHRLDKVTSGLIILAKTPEAAKTFTTMFETRQIEKFYLAVSLRKPKKKQGWIKGDMKLSRRGSYKLLSSMENPAITQFISTSTRPGERLFLIKPHTGKTHQIRVALKSLGAPIAGDSRYADAQSASLESRTYLHAYSLRFTFKEKPYTFQSLPDSGERFLTSECKEVLAQWKKPWSCF